MGKSKSLTHTRLNVMLRDLKSIKEELLQPRKAGGVEAELADIGITEEEMKNMDEFQRCKARLNAQVVDIGKSVEEYNDLKKQNSGQRNNRLIKLQSDNQKQIVEATKLWQELQGIYAKDLKKKKLDERELATRQQYVQMFGKELQTLTTRNSHVGLAPSTNDKMSQAIEKNKAARAARRERRRARRDRKAKLGDGTSESSGTGGGGGLDDDDVAHERTAQEQEFFERKAEKDKQMDQLLDVISKGLVEVKELAVDIGRSLDESNAMLEEMEVKMDSTVSQFKGANKRLKDLIIANSGGATSWCPILITGVIFLGVLGYIFSIVQ